MRLRTFVLLALALGLVLPLRPRRPLHVEACRMDPQVLRMVEALRRSGAAVDVEPSDEGVQCVVTTPGGRRHLTTLDATSKGNGGLWVGGLFVRLLDQHDDGLVYEPPCLAVRLRDVDEEGATDMIVEGRARFTEPPVGAAPVRGVLRLDAETGWAEVRSVEAPASFAW